ncbi:hypothetical protein ACQJ1T_23820 [Klebsiella pneumoniae]|jgi:hypothetical protein|uniref:hypothetical protein n=1 Tax=Enterobacteriaceae TaxID=543 RepID=UPI0035234A7E
MDDQRLQYRAGMAHINTDIQEVCGPTTLTINMDIDLYRSTQSGESQNPIPQNSYLT